MSFLDLYQGDQDQAARIQPNEGHDLPSGFDENFHAAWSDGLLFSQSVARENARAGVLGDYLSEVRQKTGRDLSNEIKSDPNEGTVGPSMFEQVNGRVAEMKKDYPDLDLNPLSDDEIDNRALAKAQAAHRNYQTLQEGEKTAGGSFGSFLGSAAAGVADPINIVALPIAPEAAGIGILSTALRWGALAGVSQAAIEFASDDFKEQVQPGYTESGAPAKEIGGAFLGGAVVGGTIKALGNAWSRVKTGQWPTSVRDAGNVIESEANIASTNPLPGVEGEVAHREALVKTIDDILAGLPVDVAKQITPEMAAHFDAYHGSPHEFENFDMSKIGSGEGAQVFGHGLYFAENEDVANGYHDVLTPAYKQRKLEWFPPDSPHKIVQANPNYAPGAVYKARITADKDKFLDLDRPLAEQPVAKQVFEERLGMDVDNLTGLGAIQKAERDHDPAEVSRVLQEAGVPGSKYLDKGSRGTEDGTRNFVVFSDKNVQITHKNGKPVNAETRQAVVDQAMGLPPKQPELPLVDPDLMGPSAYEPLNTYNDDQLLISGRKDVFDKSSGGAVQSVDEYLKSVGIDTRPPLQTAEEMTKTLTAPDHQEIIRGDIDHAIREGDVMVPGLDENGNHTMLSAKDAVAEVDRYKQAADEIQACAAPIQEAAE